MAIAIVFSLFHLGDPLGAYRSISNPGTSWLSREILSAGAFLGLWFINYLINRQGKSNRGLELITAVIGLIVIYSMASIYSSSIRPAWSNVDTYISFFGTTLVFGCVGATVLWAISILGGCLVVYTLYKQEKVKAVNLMNMVYMALVLVVIGEFIGRYVFYASAVSITIGS